MALTESEQAMKRTNRMAIAQSGELWEVLSGEITGAQLVAVLPSGERFAVTHAAMEATLEHPRGRLLLELSDCVHYSCPVNGCESMREVGG